MKPGAPTAVVLLCMVACAHPSRATSTEVTSASATQPAAAQPSSGETRPASVRVRVIRVLLADRSAVAARARAEQLARAARTDDISELADRYGDGELRAELGGAGIVIDGHGRFPEAVEAAALRLDLLEVAPVIETPDGFWVIQRAQ